MCEMSKGLISWKHTTEPEETEERKRHSGRGVGKDKKWKWKRARGKCREGEKEGCAVLCTLMDWNRPSHCNAGSRRIVAALLALLHFPVVT